MTQAKLFSSLLALGQSGSFDEIEKLPGARVHSTVLRLADRHIRELMNFFCYLNVSDRISMIKAIAVYEKTAGGLGSCTTLQRLLPLIPDPDNSLMDWIFKNASCNSCSYLRGGFIIF